MRNVISSLIPYQPKAKIIKTSQTLSKRKSRKELFQWLRSSGFQSFYHRTETLSILVQYICQPHNTQHNTTFLRELCIHNQCYLNSFRLSGSRKGWRNNKEKHLSWVIECSNHRMTDIFSHKRTIFFLSVIMELTVEYADVVSNLWQVLLNVILHSQQTMQEVNWLLLFEHQISLGLYK